MDSLATLTDPHLRPVDHAAHWRALARELRVHPEGFDIALENLDRWERWGRTHAAPLRNWRAKIRAALDSPQAMEALLEWLAQDNTDAEPLKSCSPFAGVLDPSNP